MGLALRVGTLLSRCGWRPTPAAPARRGWAPQRAREAARAATRNASSGDLWVNRAAWGAPLAVDWPNCGRYGRRAEESRLMGRTQLVRKRLLIPPFGGSGPPAPASKIH